MSKHFSFLLILPIMFFSCEAQSQHQSFTASSSKTFAAGQAPTKVAVADLNGDAKADLIVTDEKGNGVTILLGDGKGEFTRAEGSPFPAGSNPSDIAIGDFNDDSSSDLAIPNPETNRITVLLGNGSGGFIAAPKSPLTVDVQPHVHSLAVGDLNEDGKIDLVITNSEGNALLIFYGDGKGNFEPLGSSLDIEGNIYRNVCLGDVNGDNHLDIVVPLIQRQSIAVLLGNGHGGFAGATGSPFAAGKTPFFTAIGDLNGDGKIDIVVGNFDANELNVLLGDGSGRFAVMTGSPFTGLSRPVSIAIGDLNRDGISDAVIANYAGNNVTVLSGGSRNITLRSEFSLPVGQAPYGVALGDLNGDGKLDIVTANYKSDDVTVLFGQ